MKLLERLFIFLELIITVCFVLSRSWKYIIDAEKELIAALAYRPIS